MSRLLEAIKQTIDENGIYIKTGTEMNMGILEDSYEDCEDEIKLVIQQAERMEELEKDIERYWKSCDQLEEQNQRYKQALERIVNESHFGVTTYKRIANEALEEGEEWILK